VKGTVPDLRTEQSVVVESGLSPKYGRQPSYFAYTTNSRGISESFSSGVNGLSAHCRQTKVDEKKDVIEIRTIGSILSADKFWFEF